MVDDGAVGVRPGWLLLGEQPQEAGPAAATGDPVAEGLAVDEPVKQSVLELDGGLSGEQRPANWLASALRRPPAFGPASSAARLGGGVKVGAPMAGLPDKMAHRVSGDEAEREGDLADRPGPFLTVELELVGDTATRE